MAHENKEIIRIEKDYITGYNIPSDKKLIVALFDADYHYLDEISFDYYQAKQLKELLNEINFEEYGEDNSL